MTSSFPDELPYHSRPFWESGDLTNYKEFEANHIYRVKITFKGVTTSYFWNTKGNLPCGKEASRLEIVERDSPWQYFLGWWMDLERENKTFSDVLAAASIYRRMNYPYITLRDLEHSFNNDAHYTEEHGEDV